MANIYQQTSYRSPAVWQECHRGDIRWQMRRQNPVVGGKDVNGEELYVGRAIHEGDCIPGKIVPSHEVCYVAYAGAEHPHKEYQILCNPNNSDLVWIRASGGQIPLGAIQGGEQSDGQKLFIGRGKFNDSLCIGKVHPGHKTLYVSFGGNEEQIREYEVLVCKEVCH